MKFLSFKVGADDQPRLGVMLEAGNVLDISAVRLALPEAQAAKVPASMKALIEGGAEAIGVLQKLLADAALHQHVVAADTLTSGAYHPEQECFLRGSQLSRAHYRGQYCQRPPRGQLS